MIVPNAHHLINKPIICLMGPTASGKSQLAMQLASRLPVKLVSVDSALVYRGMNIGTAKPSADELAAVPHELVNICDPTESYSAGQFHRDVISIIENIHQQGAIPLLVGGTMLYFSVLQRGIAELPESDETIRAEINKKAAEQGWPALHQRLRAIDEVAAMRIKPQDAQRIQRALEVFLITGKSLTALQAQMSSLPLSTINIALAPLDRAILHQKIANRLENMFAQGFVAEVEALFKRDDIHADLPAMRTVGYRQIWQFLAGELGDIDEKSLKLRAIYATRQLAKRQLTWLRHWPAELTWFNSEDSYQLDKITDFLIKKINKQTNINN